jgi:penicillin-binding protein 1A
MMTLLQAVTHYGTGAAAAQLNHPLGGKTGTTSDYTDAWFLGFSPSVTCGVWVGFDDRQSLGEKETGAKAALPIWMAVMRQAIAGKDDEQFLANEPAQRSRPLLQAVTHTPAVSAIASAAFSAPDKAKPPAKPSVPAPVALSPAKPATLPASNPPTKLTESSFMAKPQVLTGLLPRPVAAKPQGAVKPALAANP